MLFSFLKRKDPDTVPYDEAVQAIEDAILIGNVREIDEVLDLIEGDKRFSDPLRYALESLLYFRTWYGNDGEIEPREPQQKQQAMVIESAWSAEVLDMLKKDEEASIKVA